MSKTKEVPTVEKKPLRKLAKELELDIYLKKQMLDRIKGLLTKCPLCKHFIGFNEYDEPQCVQSGKIMNVYNCDGCTDYKQLFEE